MNTNCKSSKIQRDIFNIHILCVIFFVYLYFERKPQLYYKYLIYRYIYMSDTKKKSWKTSPNKWVYLKLALLYFTTPSKVYDIAHKSRGSSMRERIIRGRLVEEGILTKESKNNSGNIDLENGHI